MTVEEGQVLIYQKDVDRQVVAELLRRGSPARSTQARERHCGICGKTGHNSRTCKVEIEAPGARV